MSRARSPKEAELAFLALLLRSADVQAGCDSLLDAEEIRSFYRALGKYYRASDSELKEVSSQNCPIDEIPVIFHVARSAGIEAGRVLEGRLAGFGWVEILDQLHVSIEAFYVPVSSPTTVFAGRPYEDLRHEARKAWSEPALSDTDIVNLVNLKFVSEYYGCRAEHVVALRSAGWSYSTIHADLGKSDGIRKRKAR